MVVQLMKYGSDPSLIDGEGCSCVHLAAQFGHTSIVAYLIAKGQVGHANTGSQDSAYLSVRFSQMEMCLSDRTDFQLITVVVIAEKEKTVLFP